VARRKLVGVRYCTGKILIPIALIMSANWAELTIHPFWVIWTVFLSRFRKLGKDEYRLWNSQNPQSESPRETPKSRSSEVLSS